MRRNKETIYAVLAETGHPDPLWAGYRWNDGEWLPWNDYVDSRYMFQRTYTTARRARGMMNYLLTSKKFPDVVSVTIYRHVYSMDKFGNVSMVSMSGYDYSLRPSNKLLKRKLHY